MNYTALMSHALHKGRQLTWRWIDEHGGWRRAADRAEGWARRWEAGATPFVEWLKRPNAGHLWLEPEAGRRWARRTSSPEDLAFADNVLVGTMPRLGANPQVGNPPAWRRDGYSGREWPLIAGSRQKVDRGGGGDIRTVWELSRGYHLVLLARAWCQTADSRYADGFRKQVESWITDNPPGLGPNWISPMDAAIRGANWALAAVLLAPALPVGFWARLLANLRLTAWYVNRYLEWHPVYRGNHYISNGVGLVYLGALFRDDVDGAAWLTKGAEILHNEMTRQVHPDGVCFEGSVAYHRLVTEFFTFGGAVVCRNLPEALSPGWWERLDRMHCFLDSCLDANGKAPLIGDADDGRLHWLCARAAAEPRCHRLGVPRRTPAGNDTNGAFPMGGFFVMRLGRDRGVVRCGAVGLHGAGCHDHNDQLSFDLSVDGQSLITDSGTYCYTRDLGLRFAFRATAAHNAVQIGGEEQNPIRVDRPWRVLADRTRATCTIWRSDAEGTVFEGRHHGFAHRASQAVCTRRISVDTVPGEWEIVDTVQGTGVEELAWRLHFAPGTLAMGPAEGNTWAFLHSAAPRRVIRLQVPSGLHPVMAESWYSERYGQKCLRPMLLVQGQGLLPLVIRLIITQEDGTSLPWHVDGS